MGFNLGESLETVEKFKADGFLKYDEYIEVTRAGYEALMGYLSKRGGRWWLVVDLKPGFKPLVGYYDFSIAPFTWPLWDFVRGECSFAAVVRGSIGKVWLEKYGKNMYFKKLVMLENRLKKLLSRILDGSIYLDSAFQSFYRNFLELKKLGKVFKVDVKLPSRVDNIGELALIVKDSINLIDFLKKKFRESIR